MRAPITTALLAVMALIATTTTQASAFIVSPTCNNCLKTINSRTLRPPSPAFNRIQPTFPILSAPLQGSLVTRSSSRRTPTTVFLSDSSDDNSESNPLDRTLSQLTSWFPFWVLSFALLGLWQPALLQWVNQGQLISIMLASVMVGTGLTLEKKDFTDILGTTNIVSVPLGVACQFLIMPFTATFLGRSMLLNASEAAKALFLGLILVGCSPGGTASNLVSLIAGADVALSVILTACSTLLASAVTPLLVKTLVGSTVAVSGKALMQATARVVLMPVLAGMVLQAKAPKLSLQISRFTPFGSVLLIAFICGGVVAENSALLLGSKTLVPKLFAAVGLLHSLGFAIGYLIPRRVFQRSETTARTISIETGMQNSALAVVLARSMGAHPLASLPGAMSATMHSCLGSILAAFWLRRPPPKEEEGIDINK